MGMGVPSLGVPINIYSSIGVKFGFRKTLEAQHFCRICHRCATKTRGTSSQMRWRELQQALGRVKPRGDVFGFFFSLENFTASEYSNLKASWTLALVNGSVVCLQEGAMAIFASIQPTKLFVIQSQEWVW